ncbi:hypothetical protein TH25_10145 [Thalassospira profundimaris]|uniref:Uncharacterized protein n=1 Tax=Thalassospira profundimaris TaxID=502049 RepID=A0A367XF69_9PROT|nr:hypothetical protein TH25_10145 [Thalassospira profundimaris]
MFVWAVLLDPDCAYLKNLMLFVFYPVCGLSGIWIILACADKMAFAKEFAGLTAACTRRF